MSSNLEHSAPLRGGRTTPGVVRVHDTVRRPPTPNSDFVRRLLNHVRAVGFDAAPRDLGTDDLTRDMLSFIPGDVPAELSFYRDDVLSAAAQLIKRFHDATATLVDSPAARQVGVEVVCHNDLSPCNFVFVDERPVAVIDFDAASPGTRRYDLAYAAWLWLDLGCPDIAPEEQVRRLSLFLTAYGSCHATRAEFINAVLLRQAISIAQGHRTGNAALSAWAEACREWTLHHWAVLLTEPRSAA
jgi:Ser/Thr protein kinase RdoA (MazF antagonist)